MYVVEISSIVPMQFNIRLSYVSIFTTSILKILCSYLHIISQFIVSIKGESLVYIFKSIQMHMHVPIWLFLILQNDCWRGYTLSAAPILYQYYIYCGYKSLWNNEFFMWIQSLLSFYWEDRGRGSFTQHTIHHFMTLGIMIQVTESVEDYRMLDVGHGIDRRLPNETRVKTTCILILTQMRDQSIIDILISMSAVVIVIFNFHFHNYCPDLDSYRGTCIL